MTLTLYCYPKCGTCRKAKKWLDEHHITYNDIHIVENPPTKDEILDFMSKSDLPARRFFNTSGKRYRELNMKDKVNDLTTEEMAEYLASDGMLIKRPIATDGEKVTVGFKEDVFRETWL
ncbi:MAG TPA: arsenate reductase family protein [Bacillota bacterium]|nr:arsenate reductase family protein [Bacillota bacterium]